MTTRDMIALMQRHMALETVGDVGGVMATLTADVTWGTPETGLHVGAEQVERHYAASILPPGRFQATNFRGWADEGAQTAVGCWDVERPDGTGYPIVAIFEFRGGRIASERLFHDGSANGCGRG